MAAATVLLVVLPVLSVSLSVGTAAASRPGQVTIYTGSSIGLPQGIVAGPDGALWFANKGPGNGSIGRITTSGAIRNYTDPSMSSPFGITAGPDGALWFINHDYGPFGFGSIGRITTTGKVANYADPSINVPTWIAAGPDGALWFTNSLGGPSASVRSGGSPRTGR